MISVQRVTVVKLTTKPCNVSAMCKHDQGLTQLRLAAGLDSTNAANIVDILAELARSGVNVILTIHQPRPDVFRLMDTVLLMSGNGQVISALNRGLVLSRTLHPVPQLSSNAVILALDRMCGRHGSNLCSPWQVDVDVSVYLWLHLHR